MVKSRRRPRGRGSYDRKASSKQEAPRVLIVTEGSKTEPLYFRKLIAELGLTTAKVKIVGECGSAPKSVVEEAEKRLNEDSRFEQIYCVFDRDRHDSYDEALAKIQGLSGRRSFKSKTISAIPSVPCFELWYMLHLSDTRKPYQSAAPGGSPAKALIADLEKLADCFKGYEKSNCAFFDSIAEHRDTASGRAEHFLKAAQGEEAKEFHENPSTRVHLLVKALADIAST